LTIKNKNPFLTFHLQQIYSCILGFHSAITGRSVRKPISRIAYGSSNTSFFSSSEQEKFIEKVTEIYPGVQVVDVSEIDLVDDVSHTLYVGPATLNSLKICDSGGSGIFFTSNFQGFNLIPSTSGNFIISSEGAHFSADKLIDIIRHIKKGSDTGNLCYPVYKVEEGFFNGPYLRCEGRSDLNYPFYQAYVVLWNFLLNLSDIELKISTCNEDQLRARESHFHVLYKFLRLHEYALHSVDKIYQMSKEDNLCPDTFKNHLKTLSEVDQIALDLSVSHSFLRPLFNFYQIRKSQGNITSLTEESQESYLIYSEEHQALEALKELFFVTLKKNEVNI
jgi:hypothetical protein